MTAPSSSSPSVLATVLSRSPWQNNSLWLGLSLLGASLYSALGLYQAFATPYVIQEDARQHVFWMHRYLDPELLKVDAIADYFQGVAPLGYATFYQVLAAIGLTPLWISKVLPAILCIATAFFCYQVTLQLFSLPVGSFISSIILSQSLWHSSELASATPRAFLYPLFLAFLYYLLLDKKGACLVIIALEALFYPHAALVAIATLAVRLMDWRDGRLQLVKERSNWVFFIAGLAITAGIVLYTKSQFDFGDVVSRAEAMQMPEFQPGGRNAFFTSGLEYWLHSRSGILHDRTFTPLTLIAGLFAPLVFGLRLDQGLKDVAKVRQVYVLGQILLASFGLYILAHLFLFELHLPNRYTSHSIRLVLVLLAGYSCLVWLDWASSSTRFFKGAKRSMKPIHQLHSPPPQNAKFESGLLLLFLGVVGCYPFIFFDEFPKVSYDDLSQGQPVYEFLQAQPADTLVASLSNEASNLSTFSGRSVLVSPEHAIAYHKGYYGEMRERAIAMLAAQYAPDAATLERFIQHYGVDFWLIDQGAFTPPYILNSGWLQQFQPAADAALRQIESGQPLVLERSLLACTVADAEHWQLVDARCIERVIQDNP